MPNNKKSKKKKQPASAKATRFVRGELDSRKACKLLPPERQTKFVQDYARAVDLFEDAETSLELSPYAQGEKPCYGDHNDDAVDCLHNLHACACLLQAFPLLTDMRLIAEPRALKMLPGSSMSSHVTRDAHQVGHPNLMNMGMRRFLVMLTDALQMTMFRMFTDARLVIHELEAQLDGNYIDFEELKMDSELYCGLTKQDVEFAVATLGVKVNRHLYRLPLDQRERPGSPFAPPETSSLLADCKRFSERQNQVRPESPVGSMNMAWVEIEARHLAEGHRWYKESVTRADAQENDVVKCTSRLEYAGSLVWGRGVYRPDMRINRHEIEELYNEYHTGCLALEEWHMEAFARGEPAMESIVKGYLKEHPKADKDGTTPAIDPRRVFAARDVGEAPTTFTCDGCGDQFFAVRSCSACKKTSYCGTACQTAHWKSGHNKECKRLRNSKA